MASPFGDQYEQQGEDSGPSISNIKASPRGITLLQILRLSNCHVDTHDSDAHAAGSLEGLELKACSCPTAGFSCETGDLRDSVA